MQIYLESLTAICKSHFHCEIFFDSAPSTRLAFQMPKRKGPGKILPRPQLLRLVAELAFSNLRLIHWCKVSGISFDPSSEAGDVTSRFEMLQNACLSAALSEEERTEYLVDFDDDDKVRTLHVSVVVVKDHGETILGWRCDNAVKMFWRDFC